MQNKQYHLSYKKIKPEVIQAIRETIKAGLFKNGISKEDKQNLIIELNAQLCAIYELPLNNIIFINTPLCICNYNHLTNNITLNKTSLISYLHEFKHYLDIKKTGNTTEENARGWSISAYFIATPELCKKAIKKGLIIHQNKIIENNEKTAKNTNNDKKTLKIKGCGHVLGVGLNNNITNFEGVF